MCLHHCWLHFASSKLSCSPASTPKTLSQKTSRLPLHSLEEEKHVPGLSFPKSGEPGTASNLSSLCRWHVSFFPYTLICLEKKQICDMTGVCLVGCFVLFSQRSDCSFFFNPPWKGQSVFQKFQLWLFEKPIRVACLSLFTVLKWVLAIFT